MLESATIEEASMAAADVALAREQMAYQTRAIAEVRENSMLEGVWKSEKLLDCWIWWFEDKDEESKSF